MKIMKMKNYYQKKILNEDFAQPVKMFYEFCVGKRIHQNSIEFQSLMQ